MMHRSWGLWVLGVGLLLVAGCMEEAPSPATDPPPAPPQLPRADAAVSSSDTTPDPPTEPLPVLGSYIYELTLDPDPNAGPDLDGDMLGNNALGAMFTEIATLIPEAGFNKELAKTIESGMLSLGYLWPGLDPATLPGPTVAGLTLVDLVDADNDSSTVDAFTVTASVAGTTPGTPFTNVSIDMGQLAGGPDALPFSLPYFGVPLELNLTKSRVSGTVSLDELGVAITGGTFTGVVDMKSVLVWANEFVESPGCDCLVGDGPLMNPEAGFNVDACLTTKDASACDSSTAVGRLCTFFAESCAIIAPVLGVHADIDTDGDGQPESHSAVLHFEASGATVEIL